MYVTMGAVPLYPLVSPEWHVIPAGANVLQILNRRVIRVTPISVIFPGLSRVDAGMEYLNFILLFRVRRSKKFVPLTRTLTKSVPLTKIDSRPGGPVWSGCIFL